MFQRTRKKRTTLASKVCGSVPDSSDEFKEQEQHSPDFIHAVTHVDPDPDRPLLNATVTDLSRNIVIHIQCDNFSITTTSLIAGTSIALDFLGIELVESNYNFFNRLQNIRPNPITGVNVQFVFFYTTPVGSYLVDNAAFSVPSNKGFYEVTFALYFVHIGTASYVDGDTDNFYTAISPSSPRGAPVSLDSLRLEGIIAESKSKLRYTA